MPKFEGQGAIAVVGPYSRRNLRGPTPVGPGGAVASVAETLFSYTGGNQTFLVPAGVTLVTVEARGAAGGVNPNANLGAPGGIVRCDLTVTPGETLRVVVGGVGTTGINDAIAAGGFGGGGAGNGTGGGGGGASSVERDPYGTANRLVVAPGGGGAGGNGGGNNTGGTGGTPTGGTGTTAGSQTGGGGGTASAGGGAGGGDGAGSVGAINLGGAGHDPVGPRGGGGGGGGNYGGGGGGGTPNGGEAGAGGGGGSGLSTGTAEGIENGAQTTNGQVTLRYGVAATTTLISDTFTENNGTDLGSRAPSPTNTPGNTWTEQRAAWIVTGNKADPDGDNGQLVIDAEVSDCTVSVDVTTPGSGAWNGGLILRSGTLDYGVLAYIHSADGLKLYTLTNGTLAQIGTGYAFSPVVSTTYTIKVVMNGSSFLVYLDGTLRLTETSSFRLTKTVHGIHSGAESASDGFVYDNFLIVTP